MRKLWTRAGLGSFVGVLTFAAFTPVLAQDLPSELEGRELAQVERALLRIKQGKYGVCDGCASKIPVARLNALPYSTLCIKCQREAESDTGFVGELAAMDWEKVRDADGSHDREIDLADLEIDLSK